MAEAKSTGKAAATREGILDAAEGLVLELGFGSTSVDKVIGRSGITKGAFFYHFPSKAEMGRALVQRYAARDTELLEGSMRRAEKLAPDPVGRLLVFLGLLEEYGEQVTAPEPGCLFASYVYQAQLFDEATRAIITDQFLRWREALGGMIRRAAEQQPPRRPVDPDDLADLFNTVAEGGFVMAKALRDPTIIARHMGQYRRYVELLFDRAPEDRPA